jgi:monoamine oxidase
VPPSSTDILILGAGAAGIACGERLHHYGIPFTILEARGRIGGRALTDYTLVQGFPLELGAQMVHGRHVVTHRWIRELGLSARAWPVVQRALFSVNGRLCRLPWLAFPGYPGFGFRAFYQGTRFLPRKLREMPPPDRSLATFLEQQPSAPGARSLLELLHAHVYAADPDEIGIRGPSEEERRAGEEFGYRNFRLNEGYTEMLQRRAAPFRDRIRTGVRVTHVRYSSEGVRVEAWLDGQTAPTAFEGRAAVVTVPLGVLKSDSIDFDPPLPGAKRSAVQRIGFGMGYALQLQTKGGNLMERFGDFSLLWAGGATTFHRPGARRKGLPEVVTAFTVGKEAGRRAAMSSQDRVDATLREFSNALPQSARIGDVVRQSVQLWPEDSLARGAYSFLPPDVGPTERETLGQPVDDVLFFAGEATHWRGESATVHGAIETGYRAAEEVHRALTRIPGDPRASETLG